MGIYVTALSRNGVSVLVPSRGGKFFLQIFSEACEEAGLTQRSGTNEWEMSPGMNRHLTATEVGVSIALKLSQRRGVRPKRGS